MRKLLILFLILILCLAAFCACKPPVTPPDGPDNPTPDNPGTDDPVTDNPGTDEPEKPLYELMSYETENGTKVAPVIDIQPQLNYAPTDYARVLKEVKIIAGMGYTRCYFVTCNPGYPMFSNPILAPMEGSRNWHLKESIALLENGDANAAFAKACNEVGLEAIAIIKPYEGGGGMSVPEGVTVADSKLNEETVGGTRVFFDDFISAHPEYRVSRRNDTPDNIDDYPITSVEMYFMLDAYTTMQGGGKVVENSAVSYNTVLYMFKTNQFNIWVSKDNQNYTEYTGAVEVESEKTTLDIKDANGFSVYDKDSNVAKITLKNLDLAKEYKYIVVSFHDCKQLRSIPYSMFNIYSGDTMLQSTKTRFVRVIQGGDKDHVWGLEQEPVGTTQIKGIKSKNGVPVAVEYSGSLSQGAENFYKYGFEFGWYGAGHAGEGWAAASAICIARGTSDYMQGTLCEAYSEVREYWLSLVQNAIDAGFDGVDIRLNGHSAMVADYANYGYNQPIADRYMELYGVDILAADFEVTQESYQKIMEIRGEYYIEFLEDASKLLHDNGKKLFVHLMSGDIDFSFENNESSAVHWTQPKIKYDWKRAIELADEITIKDRYLGAYDKDLAIEAKNYAQSLNKPVWVHCFVQQGDQLTETFLKAAVADETVDGILIYEITFKDDFNLALINDIKYAMDKIDAKRVEK